MGGNSSAPPPPRMPFSPELLKMSQIGPLQAGMLGTPEASLINPITGALNFNQYTGEITRSKDAGKQTKLGATQQVDPADGTAALKPKRNKTLGTTLLLGEEEPK